MTFELVSHILLGRQWWMNLISRIYNKLMANLTRDGTQLTVRKWYSITFLESVTEFCAFHSNRYIREIWRFVLLGSFIYCRHEAGYFDKHVAIPAKGYFYCSKRTLWIILLSNEHQHIQLDSVLDESSTKSNVQIIQFSSWNIVQDFESYRLRYYTCLRVESIMNHGCIHP
jgi:hypothetical protein